MDHHVRRSVEAALLPLRASLAPLGVEAVHWLPDRDGAPVVWLRTGTEIQRVAVQAQSWVRPQVQIILTRLALPPRQVLDLRLEYTSAEAEEELFSE